MFALFTLEEVLVQFQPPSSSMYLYLAVTFLYSKLEMWCGNMLRLTAKQKLFADEYMNNGNATQSYIKADYSVKSEKAAGVNATRMLWLNTIFTPKWLNLNHICITSS